MPLTDAELLEADERLWRDWTRIREHPAEYARYEAAVDVDLTPPCFCTIPGTQTMGSLLLWGLRNLYSLVGSWGVAIMLLTRSAIHAKPLSISVIGTSASEKIK